MFRKLSIATLVLALASGAQAQKKVATVPFCATPTLEAFGCSINAAGALTCVEGSIFDGADNPAVVAPVVRRASILAATMDHLSPLRSGACGAAAAGRIGVWEATCAADIYEPILVRLPDLTQVGAGTFPTQAQLQTACAVVAVTPAVAGTANALCSSFISVTENAPAKGFSKLGSSTWYNYAPVPAYTLIGGYQNRVFGAVAANLDVTQRYCVFWPSLAGTTANDGGGTNKWAKPIINTVSVASAATNVPLGAAGFVDLLATPAGAIARNAVLFAPIYQDTITVNYHKSGPPASAL